MANYSQWLQQNPELVKQAAERLAGGAPSAPAVSTTSVPAQAQSTSPAPASAPVAPRNPVRALAQVKGQQVALHQDTAASHRREGEAKAAASQERADSMARASVKSNRYMDAAEKNHDDNRIRQDKFKQWMDDDLAKLREPPVEPKAWQKATSILSGILAGTVAGYLGPPGQGVAYGLQALDDHINREVINQLEAKDRAGQNLAHTQAAMKAIADDSSDEIDAATKLVANHWFANGKELERIAEQAKVPEYRETARRLANEAELRGKQILEQGYEQQIAQARAAAAARAKVKTDWGKYSPAQLAAWEAADQLPLDGVNALNEMRKKARDAAGDEQQKGTLADVQIAGLDPIPGATVTRESFGKAQSAKTIMDKVSQHLTRAKELATEETSWYPYDNDRLKVEGQYAGQRASALALISQLVEAGVLNEGDAERFAAGLPGPDAVFTNDMAPDAKKAVYDEMLTNFRATSEMGLRTLGFTPRKVAFTPAASSAPAAQSAPAASPAQAPAAQRVTMYGPDGAPIQVKPGLVEGFKANGFTTTPPKPKRPDVGEMTNEQYEAFARTESGY